MRFPIFAKKGVPDCLFALVFVGFFGKNAIFGKKEERYEEYSVHISLFGGGVGAWLVIL